MMEYGNMGPQSCIALTAIPAFHYSTIPLIQCRASTVKSYMLSIWFSNSKRLMTWSQPVDAVGSAVGTDTLPLYIESTVP